MTDTTTAVAVVEPARVELGVIRAEHPAELVKYATEAATALAGVIEKQKLYSTIQGRKFVKCEGWTTLAAMLGVTPHEIGVVETDGVFTATIELRRLTDGQPVARASAECGAPDELDRRGVPLWANRPRYARRSMALTRATAKACRLAFSWVMALSGYEVTPAEEIPEHEARAPKGPPTAAELSQVPEALKRDDGEKLPYEVADQDGVVIEYGEPADEAETTRVFLVVRKAGVKKQDFPDWYAAVRGRPWKGMRVEDLAPLTAAAKDLQAQQASGAEAKR